MSVDENQLHGRPAVGAEDVAAAPPTLRKELNLFDAVAIVVGTVIGSGIFLIPIFIAAQLHSLAAVLFVWVVGGVLTVFGALSLAELGSIYPGTGGLCTYLRPAARLPVCVGAAFHDSFGKHCGASRRFRTICGPNPALKHG